MIGKHVVIDTLDNFKAKLDLIPSSAIVLIKDVGQIYAHGTYFGAQKTYSLLTKTADGLAPKGGTSASSLIKDGESEWVLTVTNGENPTWRKLPDNAFSSSLYTLPSATASDLGGIKVGQVYTATFDDLVGQYYKINVDKNGLAYVHVPWVNNPYTASGSGITLKDNVFSLSLNSVTKLDSAIGNKIYAVSLDKNGKLCVSVPWVDTNNIFVGATETKNGSSGMVPAPIANQHRYFLRGDGTWVKPNLSDLNDDVINGKYVPLIGDSAINGWVNIVNTKVAEGTLQITSLSTKPRIRFEGDFSWGYLGFGGVNNPCYYDNSLKEYNLIHSGNIGDQSVANAGALGGLVLANGNQTYNKVPYVAGDGVMEIGRYIDFHYTNNESNDRSTRLDCTGSYMNIVHLPSTSGTLALTTSNVASADYASSAGEASGLQINDSTKSETKLSFNATFIAKGDTTDFSWCSPTGSYTELGTVGEWMGILRINMGNGTTKYYHDLSFDMNTNSPQWRQVVAGVSKGWRKFAFEDSNVESANKLKTSRTIWGQSFDGTNNVTGNLNLGYNKIYIGDGSDNYYIGWGAGNLYRYHNYYGHYFSTNSGEVMRITKSGNVGIGTESPSYKLHVKGNIYTSSNSNDGAGIVLNQEKTTAGYNAIRFATNGTTYAAIHGFDKGFGGYSWTYENLNLSSNIITLGPWNNPVVYITKNTTLTNSDGNVGIGTTSPAYKLDVNGTSRITASSRKTLTLNDTVGIGAYITFQKGGTDSGGVGYSEGLGTFLSNNVSNTHVHLNADGLYYGHPTNGGVLFLHENNIGQYALLKAETLELAKATESNAIYIVNNDNSCITTNSPSAGASIRKALQFNWYSDRWEIGNIRGSASYTAGFGITYGNDNLCFRVTTNGCYANGSKILTEAGGAINGNLSANLYSVTLNLLSGASSYTSSNPYTYTGTGNDSFVYLKNITCTLEAGCSYLVMCDTNYTWCSHDRQGETGYVSFWLRSNVDTSVHILCSTYTNHKNGCWGIVAPISGQYQVRLNTYKSGDTPQFYNMRIYKVPVGTSPDTVAWANKLLNSRTIWGLSFNGSDNVSGNLSGVGSITFTNTSSQTLLSITNGNYPATVVYSRNQLLLHNVEFIGTFRASNCIDFGYGGSNTGIDRTTWMSLYQGKLGIGTTSPSQKLDVVGDIAITHSDSVNSTYERFIMRHYYGSLNEWWTTQFCLDYYGQNITTEAGHTHGAYIILGRSGFEHLHILDSSKKPIARISKINGHYFNGTCSISLSTSTTTDSPLTLSKNYLGDYFIVKNTSSSNNTYIRGNLSFPNLTTTSGLGWHVFPAQSLYTNILGNTGNSYNLDSSSITFGVWNESHIYFDARNNKVGIGTVKPSYNLDVQGDGRFTSGLIANNLVLNGNILSGSSSYTKSNPYQLSGNSRDSYVYTSMTCYLEAGNTYLMTCESNYVFCEHDRQDLSGYAGIFLRCETDSSHIYACSYTKNNLGCAGSWGFYCGVTGTYTLRFNTYKSGDVAKFWNISIKKAPVPSIGGCTSWGGYSISVRSSAGTDASTIYFVV